MADETIRVEALVIGAGPGGYVAGIRLGQLKKKALVVEKDKPGGICLNVGCIPSKALINASKIYDKIRHGADIGILADNVRVDMAKMQTWKGEVVSKLTGGVRTLLKANGCDYRTGTARFVSRNTVELSRRRRQDGKTTIQADHIVIATGSRPDRDPGLQVRRQPHRRLDGRARLRGGAGALRRHRRRLHRHRDRHALRQARRRRSPSSRRCRPSCRGTIRRSSRWSRASSRSWASR